MGNWFTLSQGEEIVRRGALEGGGKMFEVLFHFLTFLNLHKAWKVFQSNVLDEEFA